MIRRLRVAALALALVGCGDGDGAGPVDAGGADARVAALEGACPAERRVGGFAIVHDDGFSLIEGFVADAVEPNSVLRLEHSEGSCAFLRRVNPFCDPACGAGQSCDLDATCVPAPVRLGAGLVTVRGLLVDVELAPNEVTREYLDASLPHPPFEPGAPIELMAAGDEVAGFALDGRGVEPLVPDSTVWTLVEGAPLALAWTPADGAAEIEVSLNVDLHGTSPVSLVCTFDDGGAATVPAALVDRLVDYGVSPGFAAARMRRRTVDRVELDGGCVDLSVHSEVRPQLMLQRL